MDIVADFYKPLDTVQTINTALADRPRLKLYATWALLLATGAFFFASLYAMIQSFHTGERPRLDIKLYIMILFTMASIDGIAVLFETRSLWRKLTTTHEERPKVSDWISVSISIVVGTVTVFLVKHHLDRFRAGKCHSSMNVPLITLMKMVVAAVVSYRAWESIKNQTVAAK